jgi:hypothetical protein
VGKVIVEIGYRNFVLDARDAVALAEMLGSAERYEAVWHGKTDTTEAHHTYHVYVPDAHDAPTMKIISDDAYRMYKLAGKPASD